MKNPKLVEDYLNRCGSRIMALETLYKEKAWPDVVRESQETVELALKALLRKVGIEVPRLHDMGVVLKENTSLLPKIVNENIKKIAQISRDLRRDRELAFYGSEDLTPSDFYKEEDAKDAIQNTRFVVGICRSACGLK